MSKLTKDQIESQIEFKRTFSDDNGAAYCFIQLKDGRHVTGKGAGEFASQDANAAYLDAFEKVRALLEAN